MPLSLIGEVVCLVEYRKAPTIDNSRKLTEFRLIPLAMLKGNYGHDHL